MSDLLLVGEMLACGGDWSLDEFGGLFGRLTSEVPHTGDVCRLVRYDGFRGEDREVRFFGVEIERIEAIPDGMVALELDGSQLVVHRHDDVWRGDLGWQWREGNVGEFTAQCPADWSRETGSQPVYFEMSANSYFAPGVDFDDSIHLVDYDPDWPGKFEETATWLRGAIGPDVALAIEHYGSTAIPGMAAKPIIDVLVEIPAQQVEEHPELVEGRSSPEAARRRCIPIFNRPECEYWLYKDHMIFILREKPMGRRTHHIHMAPAGHQLWDGIPFRDYLRTHPDAAARYAALKHELAARYPTDRERYTDAKREFIMEILDMAMQQAR